MIINDLGYAGIVVALVIIVAVVVYACKNRPEKNYYIITAQENKKFMEDSISIQPSNRPIFNDEKFDDVIELGFKRMKQEKYKMLEGVDTNVL